MFRKITGRQITLLKHYPMKGNKLLLSGKTKYILYYASVSSSYYVWHVIVVYFLAVSVTPDVITFVCTVGRVEIPAIKSGTSLSRKSRNMIGLRDLEC